jgi:hypothetical protein
MALAIPVVRSRTVLAAVGAALLALPAAAQTVAPADVQWTNTVNTTPSGSALRKTAGCGGCTDAGATSSAAVAGDGYVEFRPEAGSRLYAGLGASATPSTDPALIDFAFSFWPDGGWDIREQNQYRGEGRFTAGDVFRVAVEGGRVHYYQNGSRVYSSAVTPALPLVLDATLITDGAALASAAISAAASPNPDPVPGDSSAPSTYDAIADRVTRTKGPLPTLGAAGHRFTDPVFGTRMMRITDASTRPGMPGRSYRTPSGTHSNAWSRDGRYFYAVSTDGTAVPFAFDASTMTASRLQPTADGEGGLILRFFNEPTFSYETPGVLFGTYNGAGANLRSVDQYDIQTGVYTQLLNLDAVVPNLAGTYTGALLASAGPVEKILVVFGGTGQDRHMKMVVFERNNPSNRRLLDTHASTVDGILTNIPLNFSIHAAAIDRSGRYVIVYPTGADLQAPRSAAPGYVWDTVANAFTAMPLVQAISGGHDAYGYGVRVNQDCCTLSSWDAGQWQFRSLATPVITSDLIAPVLQPKEIYLADHPSWHNARPDRLVPFLDATYRYGANTTAWRPWDEEIFAVQTDAAGSGAIVWRFAHHRSNTAHDTDASRISFWYTPRVNISRDGRWALFTSNWEKTLGVDPKGEAGGAYRQDMFLIELAPGAAPQPAPVALVTTSLPGATALQAYATTLQASGGSGTYAWTLASGTLPAGISLDPSTGVLAGTPLAAAQASFVVRVADAADAANAAERALTLTVAAAPVIDPLAIVTSSLPQGRRYVAYSATLHATGGTPPVTWSIASGRLPRGLALDATTGVIAGTPREHGTWSVRVRASDPVSSAERTLSLTIARR